MKFVIQGQTFSKANSRKIVSFGGRPASIKSDRARSYERSALEQFIQQLGDRAPLVGPVSVHIAIYYPDRRQDLDPSLILDIMQEKKDKKTKLVTWGGVYKNDRQVEEMHLFRFLDRENPRAEIIVDLLLIPGMVL